MEGLFSGALAVSFRDVCHDRLVANRDEKDGHFPNQNDEERVATGLGVEHLPATFQRENIYTPRKHLEGTLGNMFLFLAPKKTTELWIRFFSNSKNIQFMDPQLKKV